MTEKVNHPSHYNQNSIDLEVIEIISLLTDRASFDLGNAIKYICRAPYKSDAPFVEHLEKALWYIVDMNRFCNHPGPKTLSPFENLILGKFEHKLLAGTPEERICGKILGKLHVDICYHYAMTETRAILESEIKKLKEDAGEQHKRGEQ